MTVTGAVVGGITTITETPADVLATTTLAVDRFRPGDDATLLAITSTSETTPADVTRLDSMVTRLRVAGDQVQLHQDVRATAADGALVHRVGLRWALPAVTVPTSAVLDVGTVEWGTGLAERLASDKDFASSVSTFDGTIGIVSGDEQVRFRIYRGRIIETARKALDGPTFDVTADERTWVELLLGQHDDYVRFAAHGRFRILGSGFQYLRMTRTVRLMVAAARAMARENDADQG